ncbi:potassium/sodium hyperpolarization-activated cyclic nucleotide-gated channel 4 [Xylocopa sonorina]|uniref:potassium/sodium hyperpolarization-activated cyclic nucleotide-gated channel 4 n=1 Tax=Xylocopa sonorina TaxID=1818115 RepID=UPI00403A95C0
MKEHICGLRHGQRLDSIVSGINVADVGCKRMWLHTFEINRNTPRARKYFDSMAAMFAERTRHEDLRLWWIIHPCSSWRFQWDLMMTVILMLSFLTIPFGICFIVMSHDAIRLDKLNFLIYGFCWIDIICNCCTGYYDKRQRKVELDPWKIFIHYLKTFLILDIISSLPWDHITLQWRRLPGQNSSLIVSLINLLPCLKLTRYGYVNLQVYELFTHFEVMHHYYEMYSTFMMGFCIMYWSSCLCYLIPVLVLHFSNISAKDCDECWMMGLDNESIAFRFQHALFIVVEKLSSSGSGGIEPRTVGHLMLSCALMMIGKVLECYIGVMLIQISACRKESETKFKEIVNQVIAYTRQKQLPKNMKIRLLAYYHYRFRDSYFREKSILLNLSEQLRQEIALQSSHRLVENVAIFKTLPKSVLRSIMRYLRFELYLPNDIIVKAGGHGDCMFFLSAGTVAVLTPTGKEICHLDDGAHFGEVALLVADQRRVASVIAIEVCEVYRLDRKEFRKCIAVHTELFAKIEKIATERIERAMVIEEQHKRYLMPNSGERRRTIYY